jgi:molybdopterin converting factor subunit 1
MVKILFFASLKDLVGKSEIEINLEGKASVRDVFQKLQISYPSLEKYENILLIAVNQEYSNLDTPISPNDEIAFFPPVSGGAL